MKLFKKVLCLALTLLMLFSCCSTAFAAETYAHLPQVYVTGFQSANIYYEDDPEKKPLFAPIDTERILGNLNNIDEYLVSSIKNREPDLLYTCVYSFLWDSFGMLAMGPDGSNSEGVVVEPTVLTHTGDGRYEFLYDSRKNPLDIVPELRNYIELVKAETGSDKIELVGSSYGVAVVTTYLSVYENDLDDIDSVLLCVPSVGGISFFGELLSGNFNVDYISLQNFLLGLVNINNNTLLGILNSTGVFDLLFAALAVPALRVAVFDAVLDIGRDLIATVPAIWVTVQDQHFVPAMKTMYGENWESPDHKYAQLISTAKLYHENVMLKAEDILLKASEKVHLAVICKYGKAPIPLSNDAVHMEDGLATLEISSFGATCALYGETLGSKYTQAKYTDYSFIDINNQIDASTCLFPFTTWFLKGLEHSQKNEDYWQLINEIVYRDLTVFSDEKLPQFMQVSEDDAERLIPLVEEKQYSNFIVKFFEMLLTPVRFIFNIIKSLFK